MTTMMSTRRPSHTVVRNVVETERQRRDQGLGPRMHTNMFGSTHSPPCGRMPLPELRPLHTHPFSGSSSAATAMTTQLHSRLSFLREQIQLRYQRPFSKLSPSSFPSSTSSSARLLHRALSRSVATAAAAAFLLFMVEQRADAQERRALKTLESLERKGPLLGSSTSPAAVTTPLVSRSLPREYHGDQIQAYWQQRPWSVLSRLVTIVGELGPVVVGYYWRRLARSILSTELMELPSQFVLPQRTPRGDKIPPEQHQQQEIQRRSARALRDALTNLGPAFVKAGQQLSIRPDLVPPPVLAELAQLCDAVRPIPLHVAMQVLQQEMQRSFAKKQVTEEESRTNERGTVLGQPHQSNVLDRPTHVTLTDPVVDVNSLFRNITLVASASLGQVYKAELVMHPNDSTTTTQGTVSSGDMRDANDRVVDPMLPPQVVAIKIQRPDIKRTFSLDLFLLRNFGAFMDIITSWFTQQPPFHQALYHSFAEGSYRELDYENEARNQDYFRHELMTVRQCDVVIPAVFHQYSTERVLVTEWMDGHKLVDASNEQIRQLIPVGVELFMTQLLDMGKFHADPHPGNLLVHGGKLCILDFGLCAEVDSKSRQALTKAIVHLLMRDFDTLVDETAVELGFLPADFDASELKPILAKILTVGILDGGSSNFHVRKRKLLEISNELNEVFFQYPFSVPPFFALVTRGLGLLEGIALTGDPDFDIFRASAPFARRHAMRLLGGTRRHLSCAGSTVRRGWFSW